MNWIKKNRKAIFYWCLVLAVAPVFFEIVFFAQIMGAEVAVGFLLLLFRELKMNWQLRVYQANQFCQSCFKILQNHPICHTKIYLFHVTTSIGAFAITGVLAYTVLVWYPIVILGDRLTH